MPATLMPIGWPPISRDIGLTQSTRTKLTWLLIGYLFNHQTRYRGQVATLLPQVGIDHGVTGLIPIFN